MAAGEPLRLTAARLRQQARALVPALEPVAAAARASDWRGRAGEQFRSELSARRRRLEHLAGELEAVAARLGRTADERDEADRRAAAPAS